MRAFLTLALLGGGVWMFARWKRTVEEGEQRVAWRAQQRQQREQDLEGLYERRP